jgi:drug/metabolite transporter superfamily protein YnfA
MHFNWTPGIGDPTIAGWITVVLYFVAVIFCWKASASRAISMRERQIWRFVAILFVMLGINKQLDLQTAFTELGRVMAAHGGWYEQRRVVQLAFIRGVAMTCAAIALTMIVWAWRASFSCWLAILGTSIGLGFVLIRAASFHHVDMFLSQTALGLRWNWVLEMGGIIIVILAGFWRYTTDKLLHKSDGAFIQRL